MFVFPIAYFPLYFKELGYSPFEIALLSTSGTVATIVGAPIALHLAHARIGARPLFRALGLLAVVLSLSWFYLSSFSSMLLALFACLLAKHGADALVDSEAVRRSSLGELRFEHVRVWGSIGYVLATVLVGLIVDTWGTRSTLYLCSGLLVLLYVCGTAVRPLLKERAAVTEPIRETTAEGEKHPVNRRVLAALIVSTAFLWASHGPLFVFLSIYLQERGWSGTEISIAWNIGVGAEIALFILFPVLERSLSLATIFRVSALMTVVRWLLLSWSSSTVAVLLAQTLHAFSFAGCYLSSIKMVHRSLPEQRKDRGYGLFISLGPGVGSIVGRLFAGLSASFLTSYTDLRWLFIGAAIAAAAGLLVSLVARLDQPMQTPTTDRNTLLPGTAGVQSVDSSDA